MMLDLLFVCLGCVLLYFGAEYLVAGGAAAGLRFGMSPLIVGLTIVAFGTSAPELFVSVDAALQGQGGIAAGNVIGSNLFNQAFILGIAVMICPVKIHRQLVRVDVPVLIVATLLVVPVLIKGSITRWEGIGFTAGILAYTGFCYWKSRQLSNEEMLAELSGDLPKDPMASWKMLLLIIGGLALLVFGSKLLVDGAISLAREFGVSEVFIGLTIVAAGTSLPELATSVVGAMKQQGDMAIGNLVGSSLYNMLAVLGISAAIHPYDVPGISWLDIGFLIGSTLVLLPLMITGFELKRWEGAALFLIYSAYVICRWSGA